MNLQRGIAQVALDNERTFLYTNRVIFAHRELDDHNPYRTEELLEECPRTPGLGVELPQSAVPYRAPQPDPSWWSQMWPTTPTDD